MDRKAELERIGAERLAAERDADRSMRRAMFRAAVGCAASCGVGMFIMFFAFKTGDRELGEIFLWAGMLVGYSGMAFFLLRAYLAGERRGDW